jgi:CHASE2 domain-containing sensor protein
LPVDSLVLVTSHDSMPPVWRPKHDTLITKLSLAGARLIAFDVRFRLRTPYDSLLGVSIQAARRRGTAVVVGANRMADDSLDLTPALRNQAGVGLDCLGANPMTFSGIVPLMWAPDTGREMLPSLPLSVLKAWRGARSTLDPSGREVLLVDPTSAQVIDRVKLTKVTRVRVAQDSCSIMTPGSRYGEMLAVPAPISAWRDPQRNFDYDAVLRMSQAQLDWARGKLILVGSTVKRELATRWFGLRLDRRYGVERHADAIVTLLGNAEPRRVGALVNYLLVAALTGLAAVLAYRTPRPRGLRAALMGLAVFAGMVLLSIILYRSAHLLLSLLYPFLAFLLTFPFLLRLRRRWLP